MLLNFHIILHMSQMISIFFLDSFGLWQILAYTTNLFPVILEFFLKQVLPKAFRCLPVSWVNSSLMKVEIHVSCCQGTAKLSLPLNCKCSMTRVYLAAELFCQLNTFLLSPCFYQAELCQIVVLLRCLTLQSSATAESLELWIDFFFFPYKWF